jgi:hypothetical protein
VRIAIAVLEVHPSPTAAGADKIHDAEDATDQRHVKMDLVKRAGTALENDDVATTKRLSEASIGECPDSDILYVNDQSPKPPCVAPAHALAVSRKAVGGTSEVVTLIIAVILVLAGMLVIRHPYVRRSERSTS